MTQLPRKLYKAVLLILLLTVAVGLKRTGTIAYFRDPYVYADLVRLMWQHIHMVVYSMFIATLMGVSVGIILTRPRLKAYSGFVMYIVSLGQTIPSLAVLALVMSVLGIGSKPAIFALTIYSILPIARNTLAGINAVPPPTIDAARGMGMGTWRILLEVEIPMAMQVILTGFRIALVINIGTAALAYLIGAGGMGDWIFSGIYLMKTDKLLAGSIPVTLLALFADFLVDLLGMVLVSKGLRITDR